jgi:broad specificity phosphatase PhoE
MAEPVRLVVVRHGETVGNSSIRYHGRTDVALSELGRRQMRAARQWLAARDDARGFGPVFTSPLVRAAESARIIAGDDAAEFVIEDFVEVDFGLFEGLTAEEIAERYPAEFLRWNSDRVAADFVYPEGESRAAFVERVALGTVRMLALWHDDRCSGRAGASALLVAHRGVIRALVRQMTGVFEPHIDLGSIHILEQEPGGADLRAARWRPVALDLTAHLGAL